MKTTLLILSASVVLGTVASAQEAIRQRPVQRANTASDAAAAMPLRSVRTSGAATHTVSAFDEVKPATAPESAQIKQPAAVEQRETPAVQTAPAGMRTRANSNTSARVPVR